MKKYKYEIVRLQNFAQEELGTRSVLREYHLYSLKYICLFFVCKRMSVHLLFKAFNSAQPNFENL
jgi:hypothetical protein